MPRIRLCQQSQQADLLHPGILAESSLLSRWSPVLRQAALLCPAMLAHRGVRRQCAFLGQTWQSFWACHKMLCPVCKPR